MFAIGIALLAMLTALLAYEPAWLVRVQSASFDAYQVLAPRRIASTPAIVVAIDEASLARFGQWPWPRTNLARLVTAIEAHEPAAIGIDILMPEPDRMSPDRLLPYARERDALLAQRLEALPRNDTVLASAIASGRVVLGLAGLPEPAPVEALAPPFIVSDRGGASDPASAIPRFPGMVRNVDELDRAAAGHGLLSAAPADHVIRRLPLVVRVADRLVPSFALEMLRVALGARDLRLYTNGPGVEHIAVGDLVVPVEGDGALRVHYSPRDARRYVSALDVLDGTVDPLRLQRKLVLIGATGLAIVDYQETPIGERMPGSEIHAQLLENVFDHTWLTRPGWARWTELIASALLGSLLIAAMPRCKPVHAALLGGAIVVLPLGVGIAAFIWRGLVLDGATPALALLALFGTLLLLLLAQARRQRRALEATLQVQRERDAYVAGELEAAKRIQLGFLPRANVLGDEHRVAVAASMFPAREVGGDLYDYFLLDRDRLFFLVGDVAGKGLSASMFMAVSKALTKSAALHNPGADVGALMQLANDDISRDNTEMFFVTAFAAVLDLASGDLAYCNAGHDNPYLLPAADDALAQLEEGAGPPLCTVDGFPYRSATQRLQPGDMLCVVTDGLVDQRNPDGERYGSKRLREVFMHASHRATTVRGLVDALCDDVRAFAAGTEAADDVTALAIRWIGPAADPRGYL
jgi:serine phosphatase RsbU (regulator of sigma subunit)/CHASE2 domain-containing sensor protein